jgi:hypothetical protein
MRACYEFDYALDVNALDDAYRSAFVSKRYDLPLRLITCSALCQRFPSYHWSCVGLDPALQCRRFTREENDPNVSANAITRFGYRVLFSRCQYPSSSRSSVNPNVLYDASALPTTDSGIYAASIYQTGVSFASACWSNAFPSTILRNRTECIT